MGQKIVKQIIGIQKRIITEKFKSKKASIEIHRGFCVYISVIGVTLFLIRSVSDRINEATTSHLNQLPIGGCKDPNLSRRSV